MKYLQMRQVEYLHSYRAEYYHIVYHQHPWLPIPADPNVV